MAAARAEFVNGVLGTAACVGNAFLMRERSDGRAHRICFVTTGLFTGGAEAALIGLLSGMDRDRYDPVVISLRHGGSGAGRLRDLSVTVHELGWRKGMPRLADLGQLGKLFRSLKPNLVQGWMYHGNLASCISRRVVPRAPVVWSVHSTTSGLRTEKPATRAVIRAGAIAGRAAARIVYCSRLGARQHEALGYPASRSVIIPNGYDCRRFAPLDERRRALRAELGVPMDTQLVGLVARFHPVKDHATFLRAASTVARRNPRAHFVLAGHGVEARNPQLRTLVGELALEGRVHLLGEREDVPLLLAGLDLACLSSTAEAFPNAIGEAMATGLPCVSTNVGDAAWMIGDTGRVVPTRDPAALAEAICGVLSLGADERAALGRAARARVLELFTVESAVKEYEWMYSSLLRGSANN